ncbi:MAG: MFS transporter [Actinobacteria bacterium]|nr:MAG: MFS transporter [Actinomycetota bacterium]
MTDNRLSADARRVLAAQGVRAFAYGFGSVLLGVTLHQRGFSSTDAGVVLAAVVTGTVLASLFVGRYADRLGRRRCYAALYLLLAVVGVVFAFADQVWLLAIVALAGPLSTEVVESGPFTSLEQVGGRLARRARGRRPGGPPRLVAGCAARSALLPPLRAHRGRGRGDGALTVGEGRAAGRP